jgi:hypothetical protein
VGVAIKRSLDQVDHPAQPWLPAWLGSETTRPTETPEVATPDTPSLLPWRASLAGWPVAWRQQWGERANALETAGLSWRDAERQAFDEMIADSDGDDS